MFDKRKDACMSPTENRHEFPSAKTALKANQGPSPLQMRPLKIALIYALLGSVWIFISDHVVQWLLPDKAGYLIAQTLKGLVYVGLTAVLVYWLASRALTEARSKWTAQQLTHTQNLLEKTLSTLSDAVFLINPTDRTILYCNKAAERLFGYSNDELVNCKTRLLYQDDEAYQKFGSETKEKLNQGLPFQGEFRMRKKDGSLLSTEHTITALDEKLGWQKGVISIIRDITKPKQTQAALRFSEARHRALVEAIPDLIWLKDTEGVYLSCNPAFERFFGAPEKEILGKTDYDFKNHDDADFFRHHDRNALKVGGPTVNEDQITFTEGGYTGIFETIKVPMRNDLGDVIGVLGIARDITARKQAEEQLRKSQELLRDTGDLARVGGWEVDLVEDRVYWTQTMKDICEAPEDYEPTVEEFITLFDPEVRPEISESFQRACQGDGGFDMEVPFKASRGKRLRAHILGRPEFNDGQCVRLHGIFQDVTQRRELEEQFRQAQKMESVGRLAGGVAHDFNNMLGVILGNVDLALLSLDTEHSIYGYLQEIQNAGKRSADLTRQLLGFARKQTIEPKVMDLNDTVASLLKMLGRMLREDIALTWKPATDLWPVKIDPVQVDQVLVNLVVNARDAISGGGNIIISTDMVSFNEFEHPDFKADQYVILSIQDDGHGMDPEIVDKIFEPFFTTKPAEEGTGLGLATVYGIVRQNEGFLRVESEPGKGAMFQIYLPRLSHAEKLGDEEDEGPELATGSETILLVEDETSLLKMTKRFLEQLGYQVLSASNAEKALVLTADHSGPIDLLLTDVVMPGMNGRDLQDQVEKLRRGIKTLYMSGYSADVISRQGVLEENVQLMQKPISLTNLATRVRETLDS